ncbi:MAG: M56 family metallopeptidase, partial [Bryobacteraceae bacterium]
MNHALEALNQAAGSVAASVLNTLWAGAVVVAIAFLAFRLFPRMNAATRYIVWWGVLGALVVLPLMPSLGDRLRTPRTTATSLSGELSAPVSAPLSDGAPLASPRESVTSRNPRETPASSGATTSEAAPEPSAKVRISPGSWPLAILGLWLLLAAIQAGRIAWSYARLRGIKRRSEPARGDVRMNFSEWTLAGHVGRPVRLLLSTEISSPIAVGFRSPAVIIPKHLLPEFSALELDHVLLHELAHIARRDDWTNLAARAACALLALHPLAGWVLRQIDKDREIACDDWVVVTSGEVRPYAASLTRLFELCRPARRVLLSTGVAERGSHLGTRIETLLRRGR